MSRGQGRVYRRGNVWWLQYSIRGHLYRESSNTESYREALALLRERADGRRAGKLVGNPDAVTLQDLRGLIEQDYALKGNSSTDRLADALEHLTGHFRSEALALEITETAIDAYATERLTKAKRATVNYELAILRRMFRLGIEKHLLAAGPKVTIPKVHNEREGFFTAGDLAAIILELRSPLLRQYIQLKAVTGWRDRELKGLLWTSIDRERQEIRVMPASTKAKVPLLFDYSAVPPVQAIIATLWETRQGLHVFQRHGKPLKDYRGAWKAACTRAGLAGRIPHDLRRSAARDWRAFMSEKEIMQLCGWRSRSVFDRYNIVRPEDVKAGIAKRFNGTVVAQSEATEKAEEQLS